MQGFNRWFAEVKQICQRAGCDRHSREQALCRLLLDGRKIDARPRNEQHDWNFVSAYAAPCSTFVHEGPKLFAPTLEECTSLTNIDLTFKWDDYRQPFNTFAVVLPQELTLFVDDLPQFNPVAVLGEFLPEHTVVNTTTGQESKGGLYLLAIGETFRTFGLVCFPIGIMRGERVEDSLATNSLGKSSPHTWVRFMGRIFLNACQILTQCGMRKVGYANPAEAERLRLRTLKGNNPRDRRKAAQRELDALPMVYGFDQHIKLFTTERPITSHTPGDGLATYGPHWRRGHWREQPHGPGRTQRRTQFIPTAFVNPHLFAGELADTRVTMSLGEAVSANQPAPKV